MPENQQLSYLIQKCQLSVSGEWRGFPYLGLPYPGTQSGWWCHWQTFSVRPFVSITFEYIYVYTGCLNKFARIRRTQNLFSGYIYFMCMVLADVYLLNFCFDSTRLLFLSLKSLFYMYCPKS